MPVALRALPASFPSSAPETWTIAPVKNRRLAGNAYQDFRIVHCDIGSVMNRYTRKHRYACRAEDKTMNISFHPVRSLRQAMHSIGHAVSASEEFSTAARKRQQAQDRGVERALQPLGF
jgi:queuine/archaeosine tRNA-ribosyltransferase